MKIIAIALTALLAANIHGAWTHRSSYDDFEGVTRVTASVTTEGEPYRTASFTLRCTDGGTDDSLDMDAYFTFGYLNRAGDEDAPLRVKFGDAPPHDWEVLGESEGGRGLFMFDAKAQVERLAEAASFKVRLAYHNEVGLTTITFSMDGAKEAIEHVFASDCGTRWEAAEPAELDLERYRESMCASGRYAVVWCVENGYDTSPTLGGKVK